jgi:anti-sigma B factor antagonist
MYATHAPEPKYATTASRPMSGRFRVDVVPERDVVRVCPAGELDLATVDVVREHVEELVASGFGHLVADLRAVTFLDSTGLRLMIELNACSSADGWRFAIIPGPAAVQRAFELSGLHAVLPFVAPHAS